MEKGKKKIASNQCKNNENLVQIEGVYLFFTNSRCIQGKIDIFMVLGDGQVEVESH